MHGRKFTTPQKKQQRGERLLDFNDNFDGGTNSMTGMPFANTMRPSLKAARPPQVIMSTMHRQSPPPNEFFFDYNFDECGVLYYLGTMGKRRNWQNPHALG